MTEAFLQYLWKHKLLQGDLVTTTGDSVYVERAGEHNRDSGPDFIDARVRVAGVLWAGNVEIHVKASDWNLHRHSNDKAYNNVILHVVYNHDCDIRLENGKSVATLDIHNAVPSAIWEGYAALMQPSLPIEIPCTLHLPEVPSLLIHSCMDRMAVERLERKVSDVCRLLEDSKGDWETCCYWMIARYIGGKTNAYAFEMLAKATSQRYLAKIKDSLFRVEALLYGQAGMLSGEFNDEYPQTLQKEYRYLSKAYQLNPIEGHLWKFFRLRPNNFPTVRISQLADMVVKSDKLFSRLLETPDADELRQFFSLEASAYWKTHYRFDTESSTLVKSMGKSFADILIINAWVPLLFEYGVQHGSQQYKEQAFNILAQMQPENNRIVRLWKQAGLSIGNASQSQAGIQLYNEYCKNKRCLDCPIGYYVMVKKNDK